MTISACLYGYVHVELLPRYESYWDWFNFKNLKSNSKEEKVNLVGMLTSDVKVLKQGRNNLKEIVRKAKRDYWNLFCKQADSLPTGYVGDYKIPNGLSFPTWYIRWRRP
ncbi:hypothetical protein CVS40_3366 [Lucilia cuprina]|nr:hypothetical protein CVS40_3366 [Lucilia cuprina]